MGLPEKVTAGATVLAGSLGIVVSGNILGGLLCSAICLVVYVMYHEHAGDQRESEPSLPADPALDQETEDYSPLMDPGPSAAEAAELKRRYDTAMKAVRRERESALSRAFRQAYDQKAPGATPAEIHDRSLDIYEELYSGDSDAERELEAATEAYRAVGQDELDRRDRKAENGRAKAAASLDRRRQQQQAREGLRREAEVDKAIAVANQLKSRTTGGRVNAPISQVGHQSAGGGLACPRCGGAQFKARRSGKARAGIVGATVLTGGLAGPIVAAAVTKQTRVTCVTCGTVYDRG